MNGKKLIFIVIIFSVIALVATWMYGQKVIDDLDLERAIESNSTIVLHTEQYSS